MECLGHLCTIVPCLWDCSSKHSAYITDLERNLNSLKTAMVELKNLSEDVKNTVGEAEEQERRPKKEVNGWLRNVEDLEKKVNSILQKGTQEVENKCVGSCPKNCWSSYKLGKKVSRVILEVQGLVGKGSFGDVADDNLVAARVYEQPMEGPVVGFESKFDEVWQSIQDKDSSIIGLVGMGGVGKTTNEFSKTMHGFDLVIWIVVSKSADLGRIQDVIRNKINIPNHLWENTSGNERASLIYNKLKHKKFVVLLDDIWDKLKLSEVGIPIPQCGTDNLSKVVFTTRSEEVCGFLDAHKMIKVGCLLPDQALDLFISKAGEDVQKSYPQMQQLVKDVASECDGLPLALITIGRAMRGKTDPQQWKDAKRTLKTYPLTFPGVEVEIFGKLEFSYESLPTRMIQKCFEYCSIFPEDHEIQNDELSRLWIAEKIIDDYDDMYGALIQGQLIIESLVQACLLEVEDEVETVKMHDMIRDMALWLACERGEKNTFLVGDGLPARTTQLMNAEKVSLWRSGITPSSLERLSSSANLVTLIIRRTALKVLPIKMFLSMKVLKVLDLSNNVELTEIPAEIGCLINLEYLNIAHTRVRRLPVEVGGLKKLRFLLLSATTIIHRGVISNLLLLQTFEQNFVFSGDDDDDVEDEAKLRLREMEREMLGEFEGLEHILELSLVIHEAASVQILLETPKLQSCTRQLSLRDCESLPAVLDLCTDGRLMEHLDKLYLNKCDLSVIKFGSSSSSLGNLRHVSISGCNKIRNVSSLIYIPTLCILYLSYCESMEELIGDNFNITSLPPLFSSLTFLTLYGLPELRSICPQSALPFKSLQEMTVTGCGKLKKLPFDLNTAKTTPPKFKIQGQQTWWDNILEWDSQETKDAFTPKLQPLWEI